MYAFIFFSLSLIIMYTRGGPGTCTSIDWKFFHVEILRRGKTKKKQQFYRVGTRARRTIRPYRRRETLIITVVPGRCAPNV